MEAKDISDIDGDDGDIDYGDLQEFSLNTSHETATRDEGEEQLQKTGRSRDDIEVPGSESLTDFVIVRNDEDSDEDEEGMVDDIKVKQENNDINGQDNKEHLWVSDPDIQNETCIEIKPLINHCEDANVKTEPCDIESDIGQPVLHEGNTPSDIESDIGQPVLHEGNTPSDIESDTGRPVLHEGNTPSYIEPDTKEPLLHEGNTPCHIESDTKELLLHEGNTPSYIESDTKEPLLHEGNYPSYIESDTKEPLLHEGNTPSYIESDTKEPVVHEGKTQSYTQSNAEEPLIIDEQTVFLKDCFVSLSYLKVSTTKGGRVQCLKCKSAFRKASAIEKHINSNKCDKKQSAPSATTTDSLPASVNNSLVVDVNVKQEYEELDEMNTLQEGFSLQADTVHVCTLCRKTFPSLVEYLDHQYLCQMKVASAVKHEPNDKVQIKEEPCLSDSPGKSSKVRPVITGIFENVQLSVDSDQGDQGDSGKRPTSRGKTRGRDDSGSGPAAKRRKLQGKVQSEAGLRRSRGKTPETRTRANKCTLCEQQFGSHRQLGEHMATMHVALEQDLDSDPGLDLDPIEMEEEEMTDEPHEEQNDTSDFRKNFKANKKTKQNTGSKSLKRGSKPDNQNDKKAKGKNAEKNKLKYVKQNEKKAKGRNTEKDKSKHVKQSDKKAQGRNTEKDKSKHVKQSDKKAQGRTTEKDKSKHVKQIDKRSKEVNRADKDSKTSKNAAKHVPGKAKVAVKAKTVNVKQGIRKKMAATTVKQGIRKKMAATTVKQGIRKKMAATTVKQGIRKKMTAATVKQGIRKKMAAVAVKKGIRKKLAAVTVKQGIRKKLAGNKQNVQKASPRAGINKKSKRVRKGVDKVDKQNSKSLKKKAGAKKSTVKQKQRSDVSAVTEFSILSETSSDESDNSVCTEFSLSPETSSDESDKSVKTKTPTRSVKRRKNKVTVKTSSKVREIRVARKEEPQIGQLSDPRVIKCFFNDCQETFTGENDFKAHLKAEFQTQNEKIKTTGRFKGKIGAEALRHRLKDLDFNIVVFSCNHPGCGQMFLDLAECQGHYDTHQAVVYLCEKEGCNETFRSKNDLRSHVISAHPETKGRTFAWSLKDPPAIVQKKKLNEVLSSSIRERLKMKVTSKIMSCFFENCTQTFRCEEQFIEHIKKEIYEQNEKLEGGEQLQHRIGKADLVKHLSDIQIKVVVYFCNQPLCGQIFFDSEEVKIHQTSTHDCKRKIEINKKFDKSQRFIDHAETRTEEMSDDGQIRTNDITKTATPNSTDMTETLEDMSIVSCSHIKDALSTPKTQGFPSAVNAHADAETAKMAQTVRTETGNTTVTETLNSDLPKGSAKPSKFVEIRKLLNLKRNETTEAKLSEVGNEKSDEASEEGNSDKDLALHENNSEDSSEDSDTEEDIEVDLDSSDEAPPHKQAVSCRTIHCFFANCKEVFTCENSFKEHIVEEIEEQNYNRLNSEEATGRFIGPSELHEQLKLLGLRMVIFSCNQPSCDQIFFDLDQVKAHHATSHSGFFCDKPGCNRSFKTKNDLVSHRIVDHTVVQEKPLTPMLKDAVLRAMKDPKVKTTVKVKDKKVEGVEPATSTASVEAGENPTQTLANIGEDTKKATAVKTQQSSKKRKRNDTDDEIDCIELDNSEDEIDIIGLDSDSDGTEDSNDIEYDDHVSVASSDTLDFDIIEDIVSSPKTKPDENECMEDSSLIPASNEDKQSLPAIKVKDWLAKSPKKKHLMKTRKSRATVHTEAYDQSKVIDSAYIETLLETSEMLPEHNDEIKTSEALPKHNDEIKTSETLPKHNDEIKTSEALSKHNDEIKTSETLPEHNDEIKTREALPKHNDEEQVAVVGDDVPLDLDCENIDSPLPNDDVGKVAETLALPDNSSISFQALPLHAGCQYQNCGESFSTKEELREHVAEKHLNILKIFRCDNCKAVFTDQGKYKEHTLQKHGLDISGDIHVYVVPEYVCLICNLIFMSEVSAEEHSKTCKKRSYINSMLNNPYVKGSSSLIYQSDKPLKNMLESVESRQNGHLKTVWEDIESQENDTRVKGKSSSDSQNKQEKDDSSVEGNSSSDSQNKQEKDDTSVEGNSSSDSQTNQEKDGQKLYTFYCTTCRSLFSSKENLNLHVLSQHPRFACGNKGCVDTFASSVHLVEHMLSHPESPAPTPQPWCIWISNCPQDQRKREKAAILNGPQEPKMSQMSPLPCRQCKFQATSYQDLLDHEKTEHNCKAFCCMEKDCYQSFDMKSDLRKHFQQCHMEIDSSRLPCKCPKNGCTERFLHRTELTQHIRVCKMIYS